VIKINWDIQIGDLVEFRPEPEADEMEMRHLLCTGSQDSMLDDDYSLDKVVGIVLNLDNKDKNELTCLWTNGKKCEIAPISIQRVILLSPAGKITKND
jgi:hypothetical protein